MARKHGWQLPAHKYQVIAITVFCLLVIAFYAFLAPFLGGHIWEYTLIGIYSPVVVTVFILYVRCTAINPADPGIMTKFDSESANEAGTDHRLLAKKDNRDETASAAPSSLSSTSRNSAARADSSKKGSLEELGRVDTEVQPIRGRHKCGIGGIFCGIFVHEDCCKQDPAAEQHDSAEDALYCTLCNAEVRKFSKHCRSCDKCVDGFDHHCRWLNNCVGLKNYYTFISLMAVSLIWLALEAGVGIAVFVRCFADKKSMHSEIVDTLGNGFSRAPFATIVAISTVVSILACVPLGELFFFHMILIRKGLTTYEYVVAMRTMSEAPAGASMDEELPNVLYSPSGSATTGFSGGSALGLPYKGAWCTPPRIFVDYQDEVVPHLEPGMAPSTVDPDAAGSAERGNQALKRPVKLSAWKLAKLDSTEAMRAAAKARASSSVLKPLDNRQVRDPEYTSSSNMSVRSSVSADTGINKETKQDGKLAMFAASQGSLDEYESSTQSVSSMSSPSHIHEAVTLSPLPQNYNIAKFGAATSVPSFPVDLPVANRAPPRSGENPQPHSTLGSKENIVQKRSTADPLLLSAPATSLLRDIKRTSVVWDQEAGRYVSVPVSASESRNKSTSQSGLAKVGAETSNFGLKRGITPQESTSSAVKPLLQQADKLTYSGDSIFFGGPLFNLPLGNGQGNERGSVSREGPHRLALNLPRDSRFKRDATSNQLPVFAPGGSEAASGYGVK